MDTNTAAEIVILLRWAFIGGVIALPALGLTVRLGLKPLVDAVLRLREAGPSASGGELEMLRREVAELRGELRGLRAAQAFDAELLSPSQRSHSE